MLTKKPFFMWFLPLTFFAYQFILRLWPGLMIDQIMGQFSVNAGQFGMLAALYYYGYAGMQIPVAILLDKFSARYIIFSSAFVCASATLVFTYTDSWYLACISRFLIGCGSAVGFLGVSKVITEWFPKEQYARMVGFSFTIGLMGAIYGGKPISLLTETYPWQNVALYLAVAGFIIGLSIYLFLRTPKHIKIREEDQFKFSNFIGLLSTPIIWLLALANLLMVGALEGFADVWGVTYLTKAYSLSKGDAAQLVSFIFFGMLFGGPLLAFLSRKIGNYAVIALCGFGTAFAFILLFATNTYNGLLLASIFFAIGIMCCYQVIVFSAGSELVKPQYLGVTIAFLNCINMLGGSFFHTTIGMAMDMFCSTGSLSLEGAKQYSIGTYKSALMVIPISAVLGALIAAIIGFKATKKYKQLAMQ